MKPALTAAVAVALLLGGCATAPTVYQAATAPEAVGYTDYRVEPGRWRVTFRGGDGAPPQQVADYALRRAAELTIREGYDWFEITERSGELRPPKTRSSISIGSGGGDFGRHGGIGVGLGTSFDLSGGPSATRSIEILMGHGHKPDGADAYDAGGVLAASQTPRP